MTEEEFAAIPMERKLALLARIKNFGERCIGIDCFEQLTAEERAAGRTYCRSCAPEEEEKDNG